MKNALSWAVRGTFVAALAISVDAGRAWGSSPPPASTSSAVASGAAAPVKGSDIPATASPVPADAEWAGGRAIAVSHGSLPKNCTLELLREWARMTCTGAPGVGLVAGDPKSAHVSSAVSGDGDKLTASIVLPIRRSEASIAAFLGTDQGYNAASTSEGAVLQIGWRDGTDDPLVIVH